jgi:hypothetical protein
MNKVRLLGGFLLLAAVLLYYSTEDSENGYLINMVNGILIGYSFFLIIFGRFNNWKKKSIK